MLSAYLCEVTIDVTPTTVLSNSIVSVSIFHLYVETIVSKSSLLR